jgi:hypothetical protein
MRARRVTAPNYHVRPDRAERRLRAADGGVVAEDHAVGGIGSAVIAVRSAGPLCLFDVDWQFVDLVGGVPCLVVHAQDRFF